MKEVVPTHVKKAEAVVSMRNEDTGATAGSSSSSSSYVDASDTTQPQQLFATTAATAATTLDDIKHNLKKLEGVFSRLEEKAHEKIFKGEYTKRECRYVFYAGIVGCFNYGFVNGVCLSGLLSPQTGESASVGGLGGNWAKASMNLAQGDLGEMGFYMYLILSYMAGSFLVGLISPHAVPYQIDPKYGPSFMLGALFLFLASAIAAGGVHGSIHYSFFLASAASGVYNGVASLYSANLIRCSVTGSFIDAALLIAQSIRGNHTGLWRLLPLTMVLVTFFLGGAVSWWASQRFLSYTLLFNAALFFLLGVSLTFFIVANLQVSIRNALLGNWMWNMVLQQKKQEYVDYRQSAMASSSMTTTDHTTRLGGGKDHHDDERQSMLVEARQLGRKTLLDMFDQMDMDGDGSLDADELLMGLIKLDPHMTAKEVKSIINVVDLDGDRRINQQEWELFVNQMMNTTGQVNNQRKKVNDGSKNAETEIFSGLGLREFNYGEMDNLQLDDATDEISV